MVWSHAIYHTAENTEGRRGGEGVWWLTCCAPVDFQAVALTKQKIEQTTQTEPLISLGAAEKAKGVGKEEPNHSLLTVGGEVNTDFTIEVGRGVDG